MSVFLDSSYILAYYVKEDGNHDRAVDLAKELDRGKYGGLFISDYVFDECVTYALAKTKNIKVAVALGEHLLSSNIQMLRVSDEMFEVAWGIFKRQKELSFTDCTVVSLMDLAGIRNLATFDKDFERFKQINILR